MNEYSPTIGLEIHAELKTQTKMFCSSPNNPEEKRPNVNICPICLAHPGTLPTINREAVRHVLRVGAALGGQLADFSEFDRKNYFYPDIPKGFQISQYKYPLVSGGTLSGVAITRVHLEEDTAKSFHIKKRKETFLDFNRAGLPLMELVTEPVIKNSKEAGNFARELQLLLRYLDVSEANMEKGQMRVEANVSVSRDHKKFGTKVEVKNLNSFRSVEEAIGHEVKRQIKVLEAGGEIVQETRGFDENTGETFSQRKKESSDDYRYFPEPDLPKMKLSEVAEFQNLRETLPELPSEKRARFSADYSLRAEPIEIFIGNFLLAEFFESVVEKHRGDKNFVFLAANYITSDLVSFIKDEISIEAEDFETLIEMAAKSEVSSRGAKDILAMMFEGGGRPEDIAEKNGLLQKSNPDELRRMASDIVKENESAAAEYRAGKHASLQFLVGQAMKKSKGSANPKALQDIFKELLK